MNESESMVRLKYEEQGYDVIHTGVPDFILLKEGEIEFVEVKYSQDELRENQRKVFNLLQKHGFSVRVERVPEINSSPLLEELNKEMNLDEMRTYP